MNLRILIWMIFLQRFGHKDERSLQITDKEGQDPGKKVEDGEIIQLLCIDYKRISNLPFMICTIWCRAYGMQHMFQSKHLCESVET